MEVEKTTKVIVSKTAVAEYIDSHPVCFEQVLLGIVIEQAGRQEMQNARLNLLSVSSCHWW